MTTEMNKALKPCPFCGSADVHHYKQVCRDGDHHHVSCHGCLAEVGFSPDEWNTRALTVGDEKSDGSSKEEFYNSMLGEIRQWNGKDWVSLDEKQTPHEGVDVETIRDEIHSYIDKTWIDRHHRHIAKVAATDTVKYLSQRGLIGKAPDVPKTLDYDAAIEQFRDGSRDYRMEDEDICMGLRKVLRMQGFIPAYSEKEGG